MMFPKSKKTNCWLLPAGSEEKPKNEDNRVKENNKYFRNGQTTGRTTSEERSRVVHRSREEGRRSRNRPRGEWRREKRVCVHVPWWWCYSGKGRKTLNRPRGLKISYFQSPSTLRETPYTVYLVLIKLLSDPEVAGRVPNSQCRVRKVTKIVPNENESSEVISSSVKPFVFSFNSYFRMCD